MNELKLISKKTENLFIGKPFEYIRTTYEFTHEHRAFGWCEVCHQRAIGHEQVSWRYFNGEKMRQWCEGRSKDRRKLEIEADIKNWFDKNNIPWETTDATY